MYLNALTSMPCKICLCLPRYCTNVNSGTFLSLEKKSLQNQIHLEIITEKCLRSFKLTCCRRRCTAAAQTAQTPERRGFGRASARRSDACGARSELRRWRVHDTSTPGSRRSTRPSVPNLVKYNNIELSDEFFKYVYMT
jgi:hypothetical protein